MGDFQNRVSQRTTPKKASKKKFNFLRRSSPDPLSLAAVGGVKALSAESLGDQHPPPPPSTKERKEKDVSESE